MIPHMRALRVLPLATLLAVATASFRNTWAQAGSRDGMTPSAVADSFFSAWAGGRLRDAARLMDLDTFGKLRDDEVKNMRHARTRRMTADDYMKYQPRMPRAVAEFEAAQFNENAGRNDWLMHDYANVPDVDRLAALSVEEAAARWLEAKDRRYIMRRALEEQRSRCNVPDSVFAQMFPFPTTKYEVMGTIVKDTLAWTLFEETFDVPPSDSLHAPSPRRRRRTRVSWAMPPSVLTLRRIGDTWRVAPGMPFGDQVSIMVADCTPMRQQKSSPRSP
jgi:hypothetical protein